MFSGGRAGGGGAGSRSKNMKKGAPRPAAGELLSSLFTLNFFANKAMTCRLVRDAPPSSSSLSEKKRSAVHGVGEEEALVQTKMDPCFYKTVLYYVASMA